MVKNSLDSKLIKDEILEKVSGGEVVGGIQRVMICNTCRIEFDDPDVFACHNLTYPNHSIINSHEFI